jgi:hypothetical protein
LPKISFEIIKTNKDGSRHSVCYQAKSYSSLTDQNGAIHKENGKISHQNLTVSHSKHGPLIIEMNFVKLPKVLFAKRNHS